MSEWFWTFNSEPNIPQALLLTTWFQRRWCLAMLMFFPWGRRSPIAKGRAGEWQYLPFCPLSSACCHAPPTLEVPLPISPVPCAQAQSTVTGSCSISPSSRGVFPIYRYMGNPEGDNYRPFLQFYTRRELSQCKMAPFFQIYHVADKMLVKGASRFSSVIHASAKQMGVLTQEFQVSSAQTVSVGEWLGRELTSMSPQVLYPSPWETLLPRASLLQMKYLQVAYLGETTWVWTESRKVLTVVTVRAYINGDLTSMSGQTPTSKISWWGICQMAWTEGRKYAALRLQDQSHHLRRPSLLPITHTPTRLSRGLYLPQ